MRGDERRGHVERGAGTRGGIKWRERGRKRERGEERAYQAEKMANGKACLNHAGDLFAEWLSFVGLGIL